MTDEASLVRAIRDDPDDLALRSVYADWLEERGDPRAELVRVQCELATLPFGDHRAWGLRLRQQELLAEHGTSWLGGLPAWSGLTWHLDGGVVGAVTTTFEAFWAHAD